MRARTWLIHAATLRTRLPRVRIGIGVMLSVSLAAVAVLAVAANLIVERGLSLVETLEQRSAFTPAPPRPLTFLPSQESDMQARLLTRALTAAVDRYEHAVRARAENPIAANANELSKSSATLQHALHELLVSKSPITISQRELTNATTKFSALGEELVALTDAHNAAIADYRTCVENMQSRTHSAIDSAWKIFGRVLARSSLINLNSAIEKLLQQTVRLFDEDTNDVNTTVQDAEKRVASALEDRDLRSQSDAWHKAMRTDMNELVKLRSTAQSLEEKQRALTHEFTAAAARLKTTEPALVRNTTASQTVNAARIATLPPLANAQAPTMTRRTDVAERISSALVAWISAGVLFLLAVISAATIWSIVVPVRRMLHATAQIAKGELGTRLAPGGIKELHSLAVSFNQMAEQLQLAHEANLGHMQQLEARVEERTRQLRELALNDPLTSLPNRRQLFMMLESAIADAREREHHLGVFFLDIDNFKNINDSMGHAFGDRLLQAMARRLEETIGRFAFAARLGGDEFTIVYPNAGDVHSIEAAGWELVHAFQRPLAVDKRELAMSVSVGASVYPTHGDHPDALLQAADTALFHAKSAGRRQLALFSPDLFEMAAKKFATEQGLRRALERDEFELVFQPEFNPRTFEVSLVEALIRWRQADGRLATPGEFLSVAEECGLITELNDWVLRSAIEAAARWHHGPWPKARVAVNVSSRQLIDSNLIDRIAALLRQHRVPANTIEIELTESVLQTGPATLDALKQLRALGVAIALDDFGTGYSSLASLQQLPLTRIKLDRSLTESIDTSPRSLAVARTIINLCGNLGLEITAEGIERREQLALLRSDRHLYVQGYYLARPLPKNELLRAIEELPQKLMNTEREACTMPASRAGLAEVVPLR